MSHTELLSQLNHLLRNLSRLLGRISAVALYLVTALILCEVLLRSGFNTTTGLSTEYSSYLLVVLVFFALPEAQRTGKMIYMEIVFDKLVPSTRRIAELTRYVIALLYSATATYYVFDFAENTCRLNQLSLYATQTPLCIPQFFMVVGMVMLTIQLLRGAVQVLLRQKPVEEQVEPGSAL